MEARVMFSNMLPLSAAPAPVPAPASSDGGFSAVLQRATQQSQPTQRRQESQNDPAPRTSGSADRDPKPKAPAASSQRSEENQPTADRQPQATEQAASSDRTQGQDRSTGGVNDKQAPATKDPQPETAPQPQPLDPALLALLTVVSQVPAPAQSQTQTPAPAAAAATTARQPAAAPVSVTAPVVLAQASVQAQALAAQTVQAVTAQKAPAQATPTTTAQPPAAALATRDLAAAPSPAPQLAQFAPAVAAVTTATAAAVPALTRPTDTKPPTFGDLLQLVKNQAQSAGAAAPAFQQAIDPSTATLLVSGNGTAPSALLNAKGEMVMQVSGPRVMDPSSVVSQVANSLQVNLAQGISEVRMKLQPEHLGDVVLRLVVSGNSVQAHAVVSSDAVQQTLNSQVAHLRKQLADSGLNLTGWSVSVGGEGAGLGQAFQQSRRDQSGGQRDGWTPVEEQESARPLAMAAGQTPRNSWSRLDTRA